MRDRPIWGIKNSRARYRVGYIFPALAIMASFLLANFLATLYFAPIEGAPAPCRYDTKYNVARKLAKRDRAIINVNFVGPTLVVVYSSCF